MQSTAATPAGQSTSVPPPESGPDATIPRPEHPRPDLRRDEWRNLNGTWRFSFDPQNRGEQQRWYRLPHPDVAARTGEIAAHGDDAFNAQIVVPFPWESRLSGVADPGYKGAAWYQRVIEAPREWADPGGRRPGPGARRPATTWRRRPYLCFGAVDWNAKVWVDGRFVTEHDGGYTPFAVDLSPLPPSRAPGDPDRARLGRLRRRHAARQAGGRVVHPLRRDLADRLAGGPARRLHRPGARHAPSGRGAGDLRREHRLRTGRRRRPARRIAWR